MLGGVECMNDTCVFCQISKGEIATNVIFENDIVKCFLDYEPITEGHVLIIPKTHYLDLDEIPDDVAFEIMLISRRILRALRKCYEFSGYSIMQNGGKFNDVGHYHMHIFPRYEKDGFGWIFGDVKDELCNKEVAEKISDAMRTV